MPERAAPVLVMDRVGLRRGHQRILSGISWTVRDGERWVVLGANGSGKTTLVRIASCYEIPSEGHVDVLGEQVGRTDLRTLRARVGLVSQAMADQLRDGLSARDTVMCARYGALEPWWHRYTDDDRDRAQGLLERLGIGWLGDRGFATLSSGERQRTQLARTLMADVGLVLLDEPAAGLDIAARHELLGMLTDLAGDPALPPLVLVTHHIAEIPAGTTHALALVSGRVLASGPVAEVITEATLSSCFGADIVLTGEPGTYRAEVRDAPGTGVGHPDGSSSA